MKKVRDPIGAENEMLKGLANFFMAIGVGIIGFAFLEPAIKGGDMSAASAIWFMLGIGFVGAQQFTLSLIVEKEKQ